MQTSTVMERSVRKDYEWLVSKRKTAYEILEIEPGASQDTIRKAYRKKALEVHPDKNKIGNAEESFREVVVSYHVLSDTQLKTEYDKQLSVQPGFFHSENVSHNSSENFTAYRFRTELKNKESKHRSHQNIEILKRRKVEELSKWYDDYIKNLSKKKSLETNVFSKKHDNGRVKRSLFPTLTVVKWKNRKGIEFDDDLIRKLMKVFGAVLSVSLGKNSSTENYHYAQVTFKSPAAAALAATHDFSITADYWDSLNLRKVSSLLRSVELVNYDNNAMSDFAESELPSLDYIALSIMKRQS